MLIAFFISAKSQVGDLQQLCLGAGPH